MLRTSCRLVLALLALAPACGPKDAATDGTSTGEITDSSTLITENDGEPTTTSSFPPETDPSDTIDTIDPCSSTCAPFFDCVPQPDTGTAGGTAGEEAGGSTASGDDGDSSATATATAGDSGLGGEECEPGFVCKDVGVCGCEEFKCVPESSGTSDTE